MRHFIEFTILPSDTVELKSAVPHVAAGAESPVWILRLFGLEATFSLSQSVFGTLIIRTAAFDSSDRLEQQHAATL